MVRKADIVTLSSASLTTLAIALAIKDYLDPAIRLLFLSYILDAVDGVIARFEGPTREGFMLDRAVDRYNQVIAPSIILLSANRATPLHIIYTMYVMILVPLGFYRLVYRQVHGREYFSGLPFIAHPLYILLTLISGGTPNPAILLGLLAATLLPIPYYRRPLRRKGEDRVFKYRQLAYDLARVSLTAVFIVAPYAYPVRVLARILVYTLLVYTLAGYLPFLAGKRARKIRREDGV